MDGRGDVVGQLLAENDQLAAEVESLRAAVARVRELCTEDRMRLLDDGSFSVSVLDPADILRALDGES